MKKKLFLTLVVITSGFFTKTLLAQEQTLPPVIINEIAAFEPSDTEWIEIFNQSDASIDLTDWKFWEEKTRHGLTAARGDFILETKEYAIIANKADLFMQKYPAFTGTVFDSSWGSLKESGEEVGLIDAEGKNVEVLTYPENTTATSLERQGDNVWKPHPTFHSMGQENSGLTSSPPVPEAVMPIPQPETIIEATPEPTAIPEIPPTTPATTPESGCPPPEEPAAIIELSSNTGSSTPEAEIQIPEPELDPVPVLTPAPAPPTVTTPQAVPPTASLNTTASSNSGLVATANRSPMAVIVIQSGRLVAEEKTTVNFDGRKSSDPDGDALSFSWNFGDGTGSTSANPPTHTFKTPGNYTIRLTVTDIHLASNVAQEFVQISKKETAATSKKPSGAPKISSENKAPRTPPTFVPMMNNASGYYVFVPSMALALSHDIKITEIFPNPDSATKGEEWIELFNAGNEPVNLEGWRIANNTTRSKPRILPSLEIGPDEYVALSTNATKLRLKNDGDDVFLQDFEGNVADSIHYDASKKGESYAWIAETEEWIWTPSPTPGKSNPTFERLAGKIQKIFGANEKGALSFQIRLANGQAKTIEAPSNVLDPRVGAAILQEGSDVDLLVKDQGENSLLQKLEVRGGTPRENTDVKNPSWQNGAFASAGILALCAVSLWIFRKTKQHLVAEDVYDS